MIASCSSARRMLDISLCAAHTPLNGHIVGRTGETHTRVGQVRSCDDVDRRRESLRSL
jgi:hypothetical protein